MLVLVDVPLGVFDDDDGVIDHQAGGESDAKKGQRIDGEAKGLMKAKVPISDTGIVTAGIMVARQSSRKRKITMMTMMTASSSVLTTSFMESPTTVVVSKAITYLMPGGNDFESSMQGGLGSLVDFQRIGVGELLHADADGFVPAVQKVGVVAFRADFGAPNIFELHDAVCACS